MSAVQTQHVSAQAQLLGMGYELTPEEDANSAEELASIRYPIQDDVVLPILQVCLRSTAFELPTDSSMIFSPSLHY